MKWLIRLFYYTYTTTATTTTVLWLWDAQLLLRDFVLVYEQRSVNKANYSVLSKKLGPDHRKFLQCSGLEPLKEQRQPQKRGHQFQSQQPESNFLFDHVDRRGHL